MEPEVVCADALTAVSRTRTNNGLKYLIPSPFLAVCVGDVEEFCGPKLTDSMEGVSRKNA
jgi:hypothetical protein